MRRWISLFCALMMLPLAACSSRGAGELLQKLTALYASAERFDTRVSLQVDLPERVTEYVIDWVYEDGRSTLTVVEPQEISGICAETDDRGLSFRYKDAILTVDPSGEGVSPIEALAELQFGWSGGLVLDRCMETFREDEALAVTYSVARGARESTQRVWFDPVRLTPLYAEYYEEDALVVRCDFLTFEINR